MPEKITASYQIVTPMFIGDANQQATSISPAAVKGALRFWWRALNWGFIRNMTDSNEAALRELHQKESALFGSAADQGSGQASFKISVAANKLTLTKAGTTHQHFKLHNASRYFGYGLMEAFGSRVKGTEAGQLTRDCFNEDQTFTVSILSKKTIDTSLLNALIALGTLGALGSRSRHGMGSLVLESIHRGKETIWSAPTDQASYCKQLQSIIAPLNNTIPPFSAFSENSRVDVLLTGSTPYQVLDGFASRQLLYRSWGRGGTVLNQESEHRFKEDHDWSKDVRPHDFHPRRVVFGLPHNYGPGNRQSVKSEKYERRSSPLIFHVHKIGSEYVGVCTLLKSDFLPEGERINAGGKNVPAKIEWDLLHEFLDGSDKKGNVRFANRESVL